MNQFKGQAPHAPLLQTEIRIVKLNLDSWDTPINCELQHILLECTEAERTDYVAISYVWGDPEDTVDILLNGTQFPVTVNLFNVLRSIRQVFKDGLDVGVLRDDKPQGSSSCVNLWIDAMCINQLDLDERAIQVTRMTDIYAKAATIIAYAGNVEENEQDGIDIIFEYCDKATPDAVDEQRAEEYAKDIAANGPSHKGEKLLNALETFYERSFFRRIWIVQEITIQFDNTLLMCGTRITQLKLLKYLSSAMAMVAHKMNDERLGMFQIAVLPCFTLANALQKTQGGAPSEMARKLYRLLLATWHHQCSEERDRLYGVLGLLGKDIPSVLKPSYEKPLDEIFYGYIKWMLEHTNDLTLLEGRRFNPTTAPSWVNNLEVMNVEDVYFMLHDSEGTKTRVQDAVRFSDDGKTLHVNGCRIGKITVLHKGIYVNDIPNEELVDWLDAFELKVVQKTSELKPHYNRAEVLHDIFAALPVDIDMVKLVEDFEDAIARRSLTETGFQDYDTSPLADIWAKNWVMLDDHSTWQTKRGCYVPRVADTVYYLKGSEYATIIRHDAGTGQSIRVDACNHAVKLKIFRKLSEEEWSGMDVEEIAIS